MRRVLITGATGFLGRHLQRSLRELGCEVVPGSREALEDVCDPGAWRKLLEETQPEAIFHLLGRTSAPNESLFEAAHLLPTTALLSAVEEIGLRDSPIFILGSAAEYGNVPLDRQPIDEDEPARPLSSYGCSKLRATERALAFAERGLRVVIVRLFNVFGPDMPEHLMPAPVLGQLRADAPTIRTGSLDRVRDFLQVDVAMDALARLALAEIAGGTILNLCSGRGLNLREIVQVLARAADFRGDLIESAEDSALSRGVQSCVGNPARLEMILGFRPVAPTLDDFARLLG